MTNCRACRFWAPSRVLRNGREYGQCGLIADTDEPDGVPADALAFTVSNEGARFYTAAEFGCEAGEQRSEAPLAGFTVEELQPGEALVPFVEPENLGRK
jgi:hypothetical protein